MRVFVAGATGVIGIRLLGLLVEAGHTVAGMTRTAAKADALRGLGVEPVVCDVYDAPRLTEALVAFAPDVVIDELTDLPDDARLLAGSRGANARIRREGTRNLLLASRAAGVRRILVESVAWALPGEGGAAVAEMEAAVLAAGGVVLRYGQLYGPGTYHEAAPPEPPRIHVDDAARRTLDALDAEPGVVTIVGP
jgi:nucleoside-diphosphate-sugar epimerase